MYGLAIKAALGIALLAAIAFGVHRVLEHFRGQGRAEIQILWDADKVAWEADKAARIARTTEITLDLSNKLGAAQDQAKQAKEKSDATFVPVFADVSRVIDRGGIRLPGDVVRVLDDASRAANSARPDASREASADPVSEAPAANTLVYRESDLARFFGESAAAYADAYGLWAACRVREQACYDTLRKGLVP
jgi:cell pole-organizing protein PopZ